MCVPTTYLIHSQFYCKSTINLVPPSPIPQLWSRHTPTMGKEAAHGHLISVSFGRLGYNYAERVWENIVP